MKVLAFIVGYIIVLLLVVTDGLAANMPSPALDSIASRAAAKTVTVHCEGDDVAWDAMVQTAYTGTRRGPQVDAYAYVGTSVAFLSPRICVALHVATSRGYLDAGRYFTAYALQVLIHESLHLRGERDEGAVDCEALALLPSFLPSVGVAPTVGRLVKQTRYRLVKGVRVKYTVVVTKQFVNPDIARMQDIALQLHRLRGPEYQGTC